MQNITDLKNVSLMYKTGYHQQGYREAQRIEKGRSQRLKKAEKAMLCQVVADTLTSSMCAICPITGLLTKTDFPALPGFYFEAHHPLVHNVRNILAAKFHDYIRSLLPDQKAGLILATLDFLNLSELEDSAVVVNMALATTFTPVLLDSILKFLLGGAAHTKKSYPKLTLNGSLTAESFQKWVDICDEIEHFNPERIYTVEEAVDLRLFEKPKLISTEKQLAVYDKNCYQLWKDVVELEVLPTDLVKKAGPFVKTLVSTKSAVTVERLLNAVEEKWQPNDLADTPVEEQVPIVADFIEAVRSSRAEAAKLGVYTEIVDTLEELASPVEAPVQQPTQEAQPATGKKESFAERAARLKAMAEGK